MWRYELLSAARHSGASSTKSAVTLAKLAMRLGRAGFEPREVQQLLDDTVETGRLAVDRLGGDGLGGCLVFHGGCLARSVPMSVSVCFRAPSAGEVVFGIPREHVRCSDR
jgi:hypothetical protein